VHGAFKACAPRLAKLVAGDQATLAIGGTKLVELGLLRIRLVRAQLVCALAPVLLLKQGQ
jgi:hypothetical protein